MPAPSRVRDAWTKLIGRAEDRHELDDPITDAALFLIGAAIQVWCTWHLAMLASWAYGSGFTGWTNTLFYDAFALASLRIGTQARRSDGVRTLAWFIALLCFGVSLAGNLVAHHVFDPSGRLLTEYTASMVQAQPWIRDGLGSAPVLLLVLSLVLVAMLKAQKRDAVRQDKERAERSRKLREAQEQREAELAAEQARADADREHETRRREAAATQAQADAAVIQGNAERERAAAQRAADELAAQQLAACTRPAAELPAGDAPAPDDSPEVSDVVEQLRVLAERLDLSGNKTANTYALLLAAWDAGVEPRSGAQLDSVVGGNTLGQKAIRRARDEGHRPPSERPARLALAPSVTAQ